MDLIQFHLIWQMLAKCSRVESKRTISKFKRGKRQLFVVFTYSIKWASESRKFRVAGMQPRQRNVQNSVITCKFVVLSIKTFYFFAVLLPSPSSLVLLSSRNSATMVTWRHTSLLSIRDGSLEKVMGGVVYTVYCIIIKMAVFMLETSKSSETLKSS